MIDLTKLFAPFPPERVSWRVGATTGDKKSGLALAYIDARDVMQRLDDVCGPTNWKCYYSHAAQKTVCDLSIRFGDEWIGKANGAGDTDTEAEKGALSDAFKRAAVLWGVGRYLYDVPNIWVKIIQHGKSYAIAEDEFPRLAKALVQLNSGQPVVIDKGTPANTKDPRWSGPLIKSELAKKAQEITTEVNSCDDADQLDIYIDSPPIKAIITQMQSDMPKWWDNDVGDVKGLKQRIEAVRANLLEKAA
jgi:hypothetical protein